MGPVGRGRTHHVFDFLPFLRLALCEDLENGGFRGRVLCVRGFETEGAYVKRVVIGRVGRWCGCLFDCTRPARLHACSTCSNGPTPPACLSGPTR